MSQNIFYSWQSDNDQKVTRYFIKDALEKAIKVVDEKTGIEEPIRLDQDTQDVPGSPEIVSTIFRKIESCAIFVADLSFIGVSTSEKNTPNPNVLIELGYAYKAIGSSKIITVMNEHFGKASDGLPFDLAHRRWPIRYSLPPSSEPEEMKKEKENLIKSFVMAIKTIVESALTVATNDNSFVGTQPKWLSSSFLSDGELLTKLITLGRPERARDIFWTNGPQSFLRIIPKKPMKVLTPLKHYETVKSKIAPLGRTGSNWTMINEYGTVVFEAGNQVDDNTCLRFTQVFRSGEIWGIDRFQPVGEGNYIATGYLEEIFGSCLQSFLEFGQIHLELVPPLEIIAGISGVKGYSLALPSQFFENHGGHCYDDEIIYQKTLDKYVIDIAEFLKPFYNKVWETCGLERPEQ